eukprot:5197838-Alexandrium_andersonii.AAC.1
MGTSASCSFLRLPRALPPPGPPQIPGKLPPPGASWERQMRRLGGPGGGSPQGSNGGSGWRQPPGQAQETAGSAGAHSLLPMSPWLV